MNNPTNYIDPSGYIFHGEYSESEDAETQRYECMLAMWRYECDISGDGFGGGTTEGMEGMDEIGSNWYNNGVNAVMSGSSASLYDYWRSQNSNNKYYTDSRVNCIDAHYTNNGATVVCIPENYDINQFRSASRESASEDFLLANIYFHYQFGGATDYYINASKLNFSGTSQRELKLTGMKVGDLRIVNLFNSGINEYSLSFGVVKMVYEGDDQFFIISNEFDFDYQPTSPFFRNAATFIGGAIFGQFYTKPVTPFSILRNAIGFGGSFNIKFYGTATIPK